MFYKFFFPFIALLSCTTICNATGLMMPVSKSYPKDFLRLRSTEVSVKISGLVAETSVYEEFQNEWSDSTDAVFSFPLPADARATDIVYWYNDKVYKAILQVKEQSTNPGTGEGGLAAEVNKYIGTNGIKFLLKGIKAGAIQRIELHYISFLDYFQGKNSYSFPLNTGDFVKYPVDNVKFNFNINSNSTIKNFTIPGYSDYKTIESTSNTYKARLEKPKIYLDQDLSIIFETDNSKMGVDFFSTAGDSADGHFAIFVRPQIQAASDSILKKSTIFLLSTSGGILGVQFEASKTAISQGLDKLSTKDYFNIVMANYYISNWKPAPVAATAENIQLAKTFLSAATTGYGSNLQEAVKQSLSQLKDSTFNNAILMFTESGSNLDPLAIEKLNTLKTGIFPIGIGDQVSRARLEMTAAYNFGFTTYINSSDNLDEKMTRVINQVNQPLLKSVAFEYGRKDISQIVPSKIPTTFAGSSFYLAGRYKNPGTTPLSIAGFSPLGLTSYDFILNFTSQKNENKFTAQIWAKEMIDLLERQIEIYGETTALKTQLIDLSLKYNLRCRYTAFFADYKTPATTVKTDKTVVQPSSFIAGNYPNPFNPSTKIRIYLDNLVAGKIKMLKVYNILGQLVAVIDISNFQTGWNEAYFDGNDMYGKILPSGIYLVRLQVEDVVVSTFRINLIK